MKHRSVIAYVIVAAALFAAPQLSHDLDTLRSALGSRVSVGLMRTFLSLPSTEGAAARFGAPRPAETRLASCQKQQRPAAKQKKAEPARAEVRAAEVAGGELAMIEPPMLEPPPHESLGEVAMIIPPDGGIDPRARARSSAHVSAARFEAAATRGMAERVRAGYVAARFEGKGGEWRKVEESLRNVEASLPGTYELRIEREGSKTKVLKVRRGPLPCCPAPAPRAPRPAGVDAAAAAAPMPASAAAVLATFVSE